MTRAKMGTSQIITNIITRAVLGQRSLVAGARLGTAPSRSVLDSTITTNDGLHSRIASGLIQVVGDVEELLDASVRLKDGRCLDGIDAVIYCTGFENSFPFLEDPKIYCGDLYKAVFPVDGPTTSMAFLGYLNVKGPSFPVVELQARWAAGVFSGRCKLPGSDKMHESVQRRYEAVAKASPTRPRQAAITVPTCP